MRVLDRYLLRELLTTFLAVALILALLSLGGIVADMLGEIARGPDSVTAAGHGVRGDDGDWPPSTANVTAAKKH